MKTKKRSIGTDKMNLEKITEEEERKILSKAGPIVFKADPEGNLLALNEHGLKVLGNIDKGRKLNIRDLILAEDEKKLDEWYSSISRKEEHYDGKNEENDYYPQDNKDNYKNEEINDNNGIKGEINRTGTRKNEQPSALEDIELFIGEEDTKKAFYARLDPEYDEKGDLKFINGIARDITEKQKELLEYKNRAKDVERLIENTDFAVIELNPDLTIKSWNKGAEKIFGYNKEDIVGESANLILTEKGKLQIEDVRKRLMNGEDSHNINENKRKDGTNILCSWNNIIIKDEKGDLKKIYSIATDITLLEKRYQNLNTVINSLPEGIVTINNQEKIEMVNYAFLDMFGYSREEVIGNSIDNLIIPKNLKETAKESTRDTLLRRTNEFSTHRIRKDHKEIYVDITATPIIINDNVVGAVAIYKNTTKARKEKNELLKDYAHTEKNKFFQLLSPTELINENIEEFIKGHNSYFNEGNTVNKKLDESAKPDISLIEDAKELAKIIYSSINKRYQTMMEHILFLEEEDGSLPNDKKEQNLYEIITEEVNSHRLFAKMKDINLKIISSADNDISVYADRRRTGIILNNLINNAIENTEEGSVEIKAEKYDSEYVVMTIKDTGKGMSRDQIRYFKSMISKVKGKDIRGEYIENNDKTSRISIGLKLISSMINSSNGDIDVISKKGEGTEFRIYLPMPKKSS